MPKKILIADDNDSNRRLLHDILAYYGYEVLDAENGEACISAAVEKSPDLILLDIQMPVMDGFTTARRLREDNRTCAIKLIAQTSFAMKGDSEKAREAGFDAYISKPINIDELLALVEVVLKEGPYA
ncbi:MAG: response regulator [Nitrospirae bacterium]|nr:MAG: response regulator [Nitrospirota bacterium]